MKDLTQILKAPRTFSEVVGHGEITAQLANGIKSGNPPCVLIAGPTGVGKTSLAQIYARSAMCQSPVDGTCCLVCDACRSPNPISLARIDAARDGSIDNIKQGLATLDRTPWMARASVLWIDEAHALTKSARDALLISIERARAGQVVIVTLIDDKQLPAEFVDRFHRCVLSPPSPAEALRFLGDRAEAAEVQHEPTALALLGGYGVGFRRLGKWFYHLATQHPEGITQDIVRAFLLKELCGASYSYLAAAMRGDLQEQIDVIGSSSLVPADQVASILGLLNYIKVAFAGPTFATLPRSPFHNLLTEADGRALLDQIDMRAAAFSLPLPRFLGLLQTFWSSAPTSITKEALIALVTRFHDLVHFGPLTVGTPQAPAAAAASNKQGRATQRVRKMPGLQTEGAVYATVAQAKEIYEASTFLIQTYGVTFNAALEFDHAALDVRTEADAITIVSHYTKALAERYRNWAGSDDSMARLHRITWHGRKSVGLCSRLIFQLPQAFEASYARWHALYVDPLTGQTLSEHIGGPDLSWGRNNQARVRTHWRLVRDIFGTLDPQLRICGQYLLDRLAVPHDARRAAGAWSARRYSVSETIGRDARKDAKRERLAHLSAWCEGGWDAMFSGWEFAEHEERVEVIANRLHAIAHVSQADGQATALRDHSVERMVEILKEREPESPRLRVRSRWTGWWTAA
ncbi:MAG: AAA family ATPase [Alphaproteobacteria bacterium]|nr:MAG: AAA family ATPase [Alphaproteobacteria bacterium]